MMTEFKSVSGATPCMRFDMTEANGHLRKALKLATTDARVDQAFEEIRLAGDNIFVITKTKVIDGEFWATYALHPDLQALLKVD